MQDGISQVQNILTERNGTHGTLTGLSETGEILAGATQGNQIGEEESGIVCDAVEEQTRAVEGEAARAKVVSTVKSLGESLPAKCSMHMDTIFLYVMLRIMLLSYSFTAVENYSTSCREGMVNIESPSASSVDSSASADEGYCGREG